MSKEKTYYMCYTDFIHELGEVMDGTELYASLKDIKKYRKCVVQCGIAEVKVTLLGIVQKPEPWSDKND